MRFVEVSKPLITQILSESFLAEAEQNTHMEHLEDHIFNKGYAGAKEAVDYLYSLHQMLEGNSKQKFNMTLKWDGAPAIIAGIDPQSNRFFVGTKGVFAKTPKLNFTGRDIDNNHPGEGLNKKLKLALAKLGKLNWNGRVVQGDFMYSKEDLQEIEWEGEKLIAFKPNTIMYAIPKDSELAKKISSTAMGIVWHTEYTGGPTINDMQANFGFNAKSLGDASDLWLADATIEDVSGTVSMTDDESATVLSAITDANNYLKQIDKSTFAWLESGKNEVEQFLPQLKAHVNNAIRAGAFDKPEVFANGFVQKYIGYWTKEIDKVKRQETKDAKTEKMIAGVKFIKEHAKEIVAVYDLYLNIIHAKVIIVQKLNALSGMRKFAQDGDEFRVTNDEGFVAIDRMGNGLKLVDRLEFSRINFGTGKPGA